VTAVDLQGVIESGMCIGCGACVAADPGIRLQLDPVRQSYAPSHAGDERAASVCPAVEVDFDSLHSMVFPRVTPGHHGVVDSVLLAQSNNYERNLNASSGGIVKELIQAYLASGEIDGIISLVHRGGIHFEPALVASPAEIDQLPGSIYHALPFDGALTILRERPGSFVLIAIPCQLEGIFSYIQRYAPELADRIHTTIGLLCGCQYNHHALRAICAYKGVAFERLTTVAWRGGGPVGKLRLTTPQSEKVVSRRVDFSYQVAFDRSFNLPRCHLCVNHTNFLADIVVGDAWLPSTLYTRTGISLVICRKPETRRLVDRLTEEQKIASTVVSVDEITESQTRRAVFGDFAYAYQEFLARQGLPYPKMTGPNRSGAQLHDEATVAEFHEELMLKLRMQAERRYRLLWWRKLTKELPKLAQRYVGWFLVRVVRMKSLTGRRKELGREQIRLFR
jgi:coenzyme F420-reducing hydrogenase beta subunit